MEPIADPGIGQKLPANSRFLVTFVNQNRLRFDQGLVAQGDRPDTGDCMTLLPRAFAATLIGLTALSGTLYTNTDADAHTVNGPASFYGQKFHGRTTANGERFNMHAMTAAHRTLPFGTKVRVTNRRNGQSVVVRINDRGPFTGVVPVRIEVIS
jgi:rare lipoprotein A